MKRIELPDRIFGKKTNEALERVLNGETQQVPEQEQQNPINVVDLKLKDFIHVPSINLYFAEERSHQNLTWKETHKKIIPKGYEMPTPIETWELIFYLKGNLGNSRFKKVYDDILKTTPQNIWHGEWQNAFFTQEADKMYVQRVTGIDSKGEVVLSQKEKLEDYLKQDDWADISSRINLTSQGLCKVASGQQNYAQGDNIYFYYPRNGAVARFVAYSGWAYLFCDGGPDNSSSSLGVRLVVRPKGASSKTGVK